LNSNNKRGNLTVLKDWLRGVIYAGYINENSAEARKQIIVSSIFSLVSFVFLIIFGVDNFSHGEDELASVVLGAAVVSGVNYLFLCRTGNHLVSSLVIVIMMSLLCLYLLCTGGNQQTGPLWMFVLPALSFYILGLFRGAVFLGILLCLIFYILFVPDNGLLMTEYSSSFLGRFVAALCSLSIMAFVYEYSREDGRRELLALSRKLDRLSRKDELTGLANRRDMFERLRHELQRLERSGSIFSVLLADIDNFKKVNDTYGHECGDCCLKEIARIFCDNTQKRDSVARWGGEEFLVFLPETTGEQAAKTAERLRCAVLAHPFSYEENTISLTTSVGVAEYIPGQSLNQLINVADKRLYHAKNNGRNRVEY
jgi:diguanylate cyclase (GGDEF)-like protein